VSETVQDGDALVQDVVTPVRNVRIVGSGAMCNNGNYAVFVGEERMRGVGRVELTIQAGVPVAAVIHLMPDAVDVSDIDATTRLYSPIPVTVPRGTMPESMDDVPRGTLHQS
jgi:hypothetical protein